MNTVRRSFTRAILQALDCARLPSSSAFSERGPGPGRLWRGLGNATARGRSSGDLGARNAIERGGSML
eukprot:1755766-Pyramimonas_sp.AAC.1